MKKIDKIKELLTDNDLYCEFTLIESILEDIIRVEDMEFSFQPDSIMDKFNIDIDDIKNLFKEEDDGKLLSMKGKELRSRFIDRLEYAGYNPYMFKEGLLDDSDTIFLSKKQCLNLGMTESEFEGRT
jgi:hypothetical protein